jgi:hypothetical protein
MVCNLDWVAHIVDRPFDKRTRRDWAQLGAHHGDAMTASISYELEKPLRQLYKRCFVAAMEYELERHGGQPIAWYYHILGQRVNLAVWDSKREHRHGHLRSVA